MLDAIAAAWSDMLMLVDTDMQRIWFTKEMSSRAKETHEKLRSKGIEICKIAVNETDGREVYTLSFSEFCVGGLKIEGWLAGGLRYEVCMPENQELELNHANDILSEALEPLYVASILYASLNQNVWAERMLSASSEPEEFCKVLGSLAGTNSCIARKAGTENMPAAEVDSITLSAELNGESYELICTPGSAGRRKSVLLEGLLRAVLERISREGGEAPGKESALLSLMRQKRTIDVADLLTRHIERLAGETVYYCIYRKSDDVWKLHSCSCNVTGPCESVNGSNDELQEAEFSTGKTMLKLKGRNISGIAGTTFELMAAASLNRIEATISLEESERAIRETESIISVARGISEKASSSEIQDVLQSVRPLLSELQRLDLYDALTGRLIASTDLQECRSLREDEREKVMKLGLLLTSEDPTECKSGKDPAANENSFITVTSGMHPEVITVAAFRTADLATYADAMKLIASYLEVRFEIIREASALKNLEADMMTAVNLIQESHRRVGASAIAETISEGITRITGASNALIYRMDRRSRNIVPVAQSGGEMPAHPIHTYDFIREFPEVTRNGTVLSPVRSGGTFNFLKDKSSAYVLSKNDAGMPSTIILISFDNGGTLSGAQEVILNCIINTVDEDLNLNAESSPGANRFYVRLIELINDAARNRSFASDRYSEICAEVGAALGADVVLIYCRGINKKMQIGGRWAAIDVYDEIANEITELIQRYGVNVKLGEVQILDTEAEAAGLRRRGYETVALLSAGDNDEERCSLVVVSRYTHIGAVEEGIIKAAGSAMLTLERMELMNRQFMDLLKRTRCALNISRTLNSSILSELQMNSVLEETASATESASCFLALNKEGEEGFEIVAALGRETAGGLRHKVSSLARLVSEADYAIICNDANACNALLSDIPKEERQIIENLASDTVYCLLLSSIDYAGKFIGFIGCINSKARGYSKNDVEFVETITTILSTAVENSRNFKATSEALNKLQRLDSLRSNFSSIAAHELRTPLTSISVYIELMKAGRIGQFTKEEMENILSLHTSVSELKEILDNMLEFTRMETMLLETEMSSVSLPALVEEVRANLLPAANAKSIKVEVVGDKVPEVAGNASLLKRVIFNIMINSIKYTPEGGYVKVSISGEKEGVLLAVEDNGKGISKEDLPFIFDRHHIVDTSILKGKSGFRLGLPISKLIIERHGGRIWADSEPGKGSTFYVLLKRTVSPSDGMEKWMSDLEYYLQ